MLLVKAKSRTQRVLWWALKEKALNETNVVLGFLEVGKLPQRLLCQFQWQQMTLKFKLKNSHFMC